MIYLNSKKSTICTLLLLVALFVSCVKAPDAAGDGNKNEEEQKIGSFDFSTTKNIPLTVNYGLNDYSILFEVYTQNPMQIVGEAEVKKEIDPVFRAITDKNGCFTGEMNLQTRFTEVYLYTSYLGVPSLVLVPVKNGTINFDLTAPQNAVRAADTRAGSIKGDLTALGGWNAMGTPNYLLSRIKLTGELMSNIMYSLPESKHGIGATGDPNNLIVEGAAIGDIKLIQNTKVNLIFMHEGASKTSTLGYYCYPTNNPPKTTAGLKRMIAFPNTSYAYSGGELSSGDRVQLKYWNGTALVDEFPEGTSIGWFLIASGFRGATAEVDGTYPMIYYANPKFNANASYLQHCVALRDQQKNIIALGFEDQTRGSSAFVSDEDFNDAVFYVETDVRGSIDEDGIPDIIPDPNPGPDPSENTIQYKGSLAFEDLWPSKGDYDMNDLVIDYQSTLYRNSANQVIRVEDTFTPRWSGGSISSGFGYQLGVPGSRIANLHIKSNYNASFRLFKTDGKGLELGQSNATVMLFEDIKDVMVKGGGGGSATPFTVDIEFTAPVRTEELGFPPYNPFIVCGTINKDMTAGSRAREVHLPNKAPTSLANKALFGTKSDRSNISKGLYYISDENYAFALNLPTTFNYPEEKQSIEQAYSRYSSWVHSNGTLDTDWYLDKKNGR